jgi:hypothetical protein
MCQWHPSQTPWERKWEAKRENNWKMRYYSGRAAMAEGKLPFPRALLPRLELPLEMIYNLSLSSVCVEVTATSQECTLLVPLLPVHPSASIYEFQMLLFNVALEERV